MRFVRAFGLVVLGVMVGAGLVLSGARLGARSALQQTPARLEIGGPQWAGDYQLRFIRDAATNTCYLAGVSPRPSAQNPNNTYTITAITQADQAACAIR